MAEEKNITVVTEEKTEATAPKTENQYLLKLNRPYVFEGKEYAEIDLAGLDKLTVQDAINAQRQLFNERPPCCCAKPPPPLCAFWLPRPPACRLSFSSWHRAAFPAESTAW
jgi:hypothetical protein